MLKQPATPTSLANNAAPVNGQVKTLALAHWYPPIDAPATASMAAALERGKVLYLPRLAFELRAQERRFLDSSWSDGHAKNISFDPGAANPDKRLRGARGAPADLDALQQFLARFNGQALGLITQLFPHYRPHLRGARTSLRSQPVATRKTSWREDDSRLHVDAFPSRPNHGARILRVFANINRDRIDRVWRVGEPFPALAARFWPRLKKPWPGAATALEVLRLTKSRRSPYDHYMLRLHDAMKADTDYQRDAPQAHVAFAPDSVWLCFSDQTSHAAMSGQHMLEQTVHLPLDAMYNPALAPLSVLEKLAGRPLI